MNVSLDKVKKLRAETLAGISDCKKALEESDGNLEEAKKILRKKGIELAKEKSEKATSNGIITSYIHHNGQVGVLAEIHCQSDFVAKNEEFQQFARNIAMQIAASKPEWISPEDVSEEALEEEKQVLREQAQKEGKPEHIVEKIIQGRMKKFYEQKCLLNQPYIRDNEKSIEDYLHEVVLKLGENIKIHRFVRFELGADEQ